MVVAPWGGDVGGVIFHPDRGSECTVTATAAACQALRIAQAMGRVGSAMDNAAAGSFNSTLKVEFAHRHRFATRAKARMEIAAFSNTIRWHSANDGIAPILFEHHTAQARAAATPQLRTEVA